MALINTDLVVGAETGIAPRESRRKNPLFVTPRLDVAEQHEDVAEHSGRIIGRLDYSSVRSIVLGTFKERRWALIEQITIAVCDHVSGLYHVAAVSVGVTEDHPWADVTRLTLTQ